MKIIERIEPKRVLSRFCMMVLLVGGSFGIANADDGPGVTGAGYLALPVGGGSIAMGEVEATGTGDPFGWMGNPALLTGREHLGIGFFHSQWILDTAYSSAIVSGVLPRGVRIGAGVTFLSTPEIQGYDAIGAKTSSLANNNIHGVVGVAYSPVRYVSVGVNMDFFQEKIADWSAGGFAADLGAEVRLPFPDISVGAVIQNIGPRIKFASYEEELPMILRIGGRFSRALLPGLVKLTLLAEMVDPKYEDPYPGFGGEVTLRDMVSLRAGYCSDSERADDGFTVGGGIRLMERAYLDYAYTPYGDLGDFHRISIFFGMGD